MGDEVDEQEFSQTALAMTVGCCFAAAVHAGDAEFVAEMLDDPDEPVEALALGLAHLVLMLIEAAGDDPREVLSQIIDGVAPGIQGEHSVEQAGALKPLSDTEQRPLVLEFFDTVRGDAGPDGVVKVSQFWWRVRHTSNGLIVGASSEGYSSRGARDDNAALLHPDLEPVEVDS